MCAARSISTFAVKLIVLWSTVLQSSVYSCSQPLISDATVDVQKMLHDCAKFPLLPLHSFNTVYNALLSFSPQFSITQQTICITVDAVNWTLYKLVDQIKTESRFMNLHIEHGITVIRYNTILSKMSVHYLIKSIRTSLYSKLKPRCHYDCTYWYKRRQKAVCCLLRLLLSSTSSMDRSR
jgi:hypothetical protein